MALSTTTTSNGDGFLRDSLADCAACRRSVRLDDDFVRLRDSLYHLNCLLTALRDLGHEAALRDGVTALRSGGARAA